MFKRQSPKKEVYAALKLRRLPDRKRRRRTALVLSCAAVAGVLALSLYLRRLSCEIAMSDAIDAVNLAINESVTELLREREYGYDWFVSLEKDGAGSITAITTNAAHINAFSAELLTEIVRNADNQRLDIRIPLGNLLGSNLLLGRGPEVPVEILMLTSSFVRFEQDLRSTGINQTRHTLTLQARVDIDILIPWATVSTTAESDILLAETLIIGRVPETYVNYTEDKHGSE